MTLLVALQAFSEGFQGVFRSSERKRFSSHCFYMHVERLLLYGDVCGDRWGEVNAPPTQFPPRFSCFVFAVVGVLQTRCQTLEPQAGVSSIAMAIVCCRGVH